MQVALPWPNRTLSQNSRAHRLTVARNARTERWEARVRCLEAGLRKPGWEGARLAFTICPPDARRRDLQNVIGSLKAAVDGIADALGVDDSRFRIRWPEAFSEPRRGGVVLVTVEPIVAGTAA